MEQEVIRVLQDWTKRVVDAGETFCRIAKERCETEDDINDLFLLISKYWMEGKDVTEVADTDEGRGT